MGWSYPSMVAAVAILHTPSLNAPEGLIYTGKTAWEASSSTLTFETSGSMPDTKEGFYWQVPASVRVIRIGSKVSVFGGFRVLPRRADNPLLIAGTDRETSVICGTDTLKWTTAHHVADNDKWKYGAVCVLGDAVVRVAKLTSKNPRGYHISGYADKAVIHVEKCNLIDARKGDNNNSDGFVGAAGSSITDSFISTSDDGIKVYRDIAIKNVTIEQHRNGSPIQFGWGGESGAARADISDLTIVGVDPEGLYNMAPFTWEAGAKGVREVVVDGLNVKVDGKVYHHERKEWQPLGLLALKPESCTFNLTIRSGEIAVPGRSVIRTSGKVVVNGKPYP